MEDWELCRRGRTGRLFEVVDATNFLAGASFLSGLAGDLVLEDERDDIRSLVEPSDWLAPLALC